MLITLATPLPPPPFNSVSSKARRWPDASHFDTVQFRHSAISTQKRHFDTKTLQKVSHFDTALDVLTHFLTNAYLCLFMGFQNMDFVLVDFKIP